jgi:hypothetical protein
VSANEAIKVARDAGIELTIDGDDLVLEAPAPPPATVLDLLSRHKAEVVAVLAASTLKSAPVTEAPKLDLAAPPDPKPTKPRLRRLRWRRTFRPLLRLRRVGFVWLQRQSANGSARHMVLPRASAART